LLVEKLELSQELRCQYPDVLLYADGSEIEIGTPTVPVTVHCVCVKHERGPKLRSFNIEEEKDTEESLSQTGTNSLRIEKIGREVN